MKCFKFLVPILLVKAVQVRKQGVLVLDIVSYVYYYHHEMSVVTRLFPLF